ncbi:hypothetical protein SAMN05661044_01449 [Olivibacter domesticus]|uniref:Uncharacterized protein n=1 Tax=Olivibacter domesticus TaxID=407022 RepID=A0A1H7KS55_OLID1|nr:hypothetical protein SAMN05661044_01449 [Olivibacter domesticus]
MKIVLSDTKEIRDSALGIMVRHIAGEVVDVFSPIRQDYL